MCGRRRRCLRWRSCRRPHEDAHHASKLCRRERDGTPISNRQPGTVAGCCHLCKPFVSSCLHGLGILDDMLCKRVRPPHVLQALVGSGGLLAKQLLQFNATMLRQLLGKSVKNVSKLASGFGIEPQKVVKLAIGCQLSNSVCMLLNGAPPEGRAPSTKPARLLSALCQVPEACQGMGLDQLSGVDQPLGAAAASCKEVWGTST